MVGPAELVRLESDLMERVAELKVQGPGDVQVRRISEISAVQMLRRCQAALDDDDQAWLGQRLADVRSEGFGIQVTGFSRLSQEAQIYRPEIDESDPADKAVRRFGGLIVGLLGFVNLRGLLEKLFPPKFEPRSGAPLSVPENLMLAAEAWLVAGLCRGRIDVDLTPLQRPWLEAFVEG